MDTKLRSGLSLSTIPANRHLVDGLATRKLISPEARQFALDLLYPRLNWGRWIAAILSVVGTALILSGIVYFFAFNWKKIPSFYKLGSIQLAILGCLFAAYWCGIHARSSAKILVLSASVLTGVFLAVFGQIYQTGADSYNLFLVWAVLILPWTILTQFAALWFTWLVVTNVCFLLWWDQGMQPGRDMDTLQFTILVIGNGLFIMLREFAVTRNANWLHEKWTRLVLIIPVLCFSLVPALTLIFHYKRATPAVLTGAVVTAAAHGLLYLFYRYKRPDMWVLAATILSLCLLGEAVVCRTLAEFIRFESAATFLLLGIITISIFTFAIVRLRVVQKKLAQLHV